MSRWNDAERHGLMGEEAGNRFEVMVLGGDVEYSLGEP